MAHVVIAKLTDAQFTQLEQSGIPYREFPNAFLDRLQALAPALALDEIFERLVKQGLKLAELRKFEEATNLQARSAVVNKSQALDQELEL